MSVNERAAAQRVARGTPPAGAGWQLGCGVLAGPLFVAVVLVQGLTREGFDLTHHTLSLLSLGGLGWIQITNFVVAGVLLVAFAAGVRRTLHPGPSGTWAPLLFALAGLGLVMAGVFVTDAGAGFPPGAPEGAPEQISWHGALHSVGFVVASIGLAGGFLAAVRRFVAGRQWGWVALCVVVVIAFLGLTAQPSAEDFALRALIGTAAALGGVVALAAHLRRVPGPPPESVGDPG